MKSHFFLRIIFFYLIFFSFAVFSANPFPYENNLSPIKRKSNALYWQTTSAFSIVPILNTPPVIHAVGNQVYCPGTVMKIVTDVTINYTDEIDTDAIYIQISAGYSIGNDFLTLSNPESHPTITSSWNNTEGKLKLSSPIAGTKVTYTEFIAAIKDVTYSNSSANPSGIKNFSISIGQANYLPRNKHFYEYVPNLGITWTAARDAAAIKTHYGLQGYLATLTTDDEAQLAGAQAPGTGWIGGTDEQNEGTWRWVTGPEGLEDGGSGRLFWIGKNNGTSTAPDYYANWNNNEPNNNIQSFKPNGENYAHITAPGIGKPGAWNDLSNDGDPPGSYHPKGYIVEYGGMIPGDVDLIQISASTTISISKITSTTPKSRCGTGTVTLEATAIDGTVYWYTSLSEITPIASGNSFTTPTISSSTTYYVDAGCINERKPVTATIFPLPIVNDITIFQCDSDLIPDGKTLFNLTVNNDIISSNYNNETFSYYTSSNGANNALASDLISNEQAFENTTPTSMDIWVRVTNKTTGCYNMAKITLKVSATNIPSNYKIAIPAVCDDFLDTNGNNTINNNERDGITSFDLSTTKATIQTLLPTTEVYTISYYKNKADALTETNAINNLSNYRNIGYPNSQDIWVRIDSNLDNACYGLGPYITLKTEALPIANSVSITRQCDDNDDGIFTFNTSTLESDLLKGQTNVNITYFDQSNNPLKDANGILITSPFPANFTTTSQTIKAVVTNNTSAQCSDETTIKFIVDKTPVAFSVSTTLTSTCDDELNPLSQDGKFAFNTSTFEAIILGGQTGMNVLYFDKNNNPLPSPLPNPFITGTQNILATVVNPLNTNCSDSTILNFIVNPLPNIDLNLNGEGNELVCSNLSTFFVNLDAGITDNSPSTNYYYIWTKDGQVIGTNSPTLDVNAEGIYTVEVTNQLGCSKIRTLTVTASNSATVTSIDIVDLSDLNTVTVNTTGPGNYEYSLDTPNGLWQDSNFFNNVPSGIHEVYINDKNGCGVVNKTIVVVGAPKFFTPNNDGYNDYWNIKGVNATYYPKSIIYIFNRYGKLIKQWIPYLNQGWDGTFNGVPLPSDDYWFTLKLEDGREAKGHFSLKR